MFLLMSKWSWEVDMRLGRDLLSSVAFSRTIQLQDGKCLQNRRILSVATLKGSIYRRMWGIPVAVKYQPLSHVHVQSTDELEIHKTSYK